MNALTAVAIAITSLAIVTLGDLVSEEVRARLDQIPLTLLRLAVRRLPERLREEFGQDWWAELDHILHRAQLYPVTRFIVGIRFSASLLFKAPSVARELTDGTARRSPREILTSEFVSAKCSYFYSVLRKVLLPVLFGASAYLLSALFVDSPVWQLSFSAFNGGVALIVQILAGFGRRLRGLERQQGDHLERMQELFNGPRFLRNIAQTEISRLSQFLRDLAGGVEIVYPGQDRDWLLALATHARSTIDAISMTAVVPGEKASGGGFWNTDVGLRYLEIQRGACQRGVTVRRIFVVDRPAGRDFENICDRQASIGVDVRVLRPHTLTGADKARLLDSIVFDGVVSYETHPVTESGPAPVNTRLVLDPGQVRRRRELFEDLWNAASPLGPGTT